LGLLCDSERFLQMSVQIFGSIMGPKGFFEGARTECGELRRIGLDAGANLNGVRIEHGSAHEPGVPDVMGKDHRKA
jgi:hypothetical protein